MYIDISEFATLYSSVSKNRAAWPFPSESRRVRVFLYSAEGLGVGGVLAALFDVLVLRVVYLLSSVPPILSASTVAFLVIGTVLVVRWAGILSAVRRTPSSRSRSPVVQDWHETREWTVVITIAVLTLAAILGTSLAF